MGGMETALVRGAVVLLAIVGTTPLVFAADSVTTTLSGASENFTLTAVNATNAGNPSITATTTWALGPPNTLLIYAYFLSSTALTDGAGHSIRSSAFSISDNGGAYQTTTGTVINPNNGSTICTNCVRLENISITPFTKTGTVNDTMTFNLNLSALPQLPAATYTGTLYVQGTAAGPGGTTSGPQLIAVTATLAESLTVSLSAHAVTFSLTAGNPTNAGSSSITASTAWVMKPSRTAVELYAYFSSAAAALTDGSGDSIPSSAFFISDNGGASTALTNTVAFGGASAGLRLANVAITSANENSSRTDAMSFNINLSGGTLPQLPAGTYTGTLNIQAQATP